MVNPHLSGEYYLQFDYEIMPDVWYVAELTVQYQRSGELGGVKAGRFGPVKMRSTSRFPRFLGPLQDQADPDLIVYDENAALTSIDILPPPVTTDDDLQVSATTTAAKYGDALNAENTLIFTISAGPAALGRVLKDEKQSRQWLDVLARNHNQNASSMEQQVLSPGILFFIELMNGFQF